MGIWLILLILVVLILVTLLILVLASTVTFRIHIILRSKEYRMMVNIRLLYGMINVQYEVPFNLTDKGVRYSDRSLSSDPSKQRIDEPEKDMENKREFNFSNYHVLVQATKGLKNWFLNTLSIVRLSEVHWATSLALDNAAESAVAAGTVWGIKHTILGLLSFHLKLENTPQIQVHPDFNGPPQISTDLSFVIRITCAKAIFAGLMLMIRIVSIKGGMKIWRRTLFRA